MISTRRYEGGLAAEALHQLEAEHATIEVERTLQIGDLQVDMADPDTTIDGRRGDRRRARDVLGSCSPL
jgi:hypothetical protein